MPLLPKSACLPLLLGSLPHRSPAQALAASRRYANAILCWPQLPQRSIREQAVIQAAAGFPGLVVDPVRGQVYVDRAVAITQIDQLGLAYLTHDLSNAAIDDDAAAGLAELTRQRDSLRGIMTLKGQLLGPISLATQLTDEHQRPLIYDEMLFEALAHHLHLRAAWQNAALAELNISTIICIDEPFLDTIGLPFMPINWEQARSHIDEVLAGISGIKALYAGSMTDWQRLFQTSAELVIAEVYQQPTALAQAIPALTEFLERGGMLGLGLIPAEADMLATVTMKGLLQRVETLLKTLHPIIEPKMFLQHALLAPTHMLGHLSVEQAEYAMQLLAELSQIVRKEYALEE